MKTLSLIGVTASFALTGVVVAHVAEAPQMDANVKDAIQLFQRTDPDLKKYFDTCDGYAVFPNIGKGAAGVGVAEGRGQVFEKGVLAGGAKMTQVTVGAQLGGQNYAEVIFFETPRALDEFRHGKLAMSAGLSAVAAASGASANAKYEHGVLIFSVANSGLMFEASIGGQKFKFIPVATAAAPSRRSHSGRPEIGYGNPAPPPRLETAPASPPAETAPESTPPPPPAQ